MPYTEAAGFSNSSVPDPSPIPLLAAPRRACHPCEGVEESTELVDALHDQRSWCGFVVALGGSSHGREGMGERVSLVIATSRTRNVLPDVG
jgi:hypothetical protein